jgi:hypothetical protein
MAGNDWVDHHHGSLQRLLRARCPLARLPELDAIVVPTTRDPAGLTEAPRLLANWPAPL